MANLPPSPFTTSVATVERPTEAPAAAFPSPQARDAAAACSDISDIGEIFVGAAKLIDPEARFVLDVDRFMAELDEPPLFLRQAV